MAKGSDLIIKILADITDVQNKSVKVDNIFKELSRTINDASSYGMAKHMDLANRLDSIGSTFETVGSKMTRTFTLPIVAGLGASAKAAIDFEDDFAGVRKTVDASEEEFAQLNKEIREMAKVMPESANVIANVMEIAGQLGIATEDLTEFTEVMVNMGVATNLTAEEAATTFARFSNIMQTAADDYERLGSTTVELGNNYATTESEITNMALRLAGSAKQLHMSEADVLGLSAALTSVGIRAEAGGTSMSKLMDSMNIATAMGNKQMKALEEQTGMTMKELHLMSANNSKDFTALADSMNMPVGQMKNIVKAGYDLQKMADIAKMSVDDFSEMVREDAVGALGAFMEGLADSNHHNADAIELIKELDINERRLTDTMLRTSSASDMLKESVEMANVAWRENTALKDEAEQKYETTKSQLIILKNTFKDLAITIGNAMLPMIKDLSKFLGGLVEKINTMSPERVESIVKNLLKLAALGPTIKIFGGLLGKAGKVVELTGNIKTLSTAFGSLADNASKIRGAANFGDFLKGGWSEAQLLGQNPIIGKDGNIKFIKQSYDAHIQGLEGVALKNHKIDGTLGKLFVSSEKLKKSPVFTGSLWSRMKASVDVAKGGVTNMGTSIKGMGSVAGKVVKTPFFAGAVFLGLANHLRKTYQSSEEFRAGVNKLWETLANTGPGKVMARIFFEIGDVFKMVGEAAKWVGGLFTGLFDTLTNGQGTTKEFIMIVGGIVAAFTPIGPVIGLVTAGIGLLTTGFKAFGAEQVAQDKINRAWTEGVTEMGNELTNMETKAMLVAKDSLPQLQEALQTSFDIMNNPENLKSGEEALEALSGQNKQMLESQSEMLNTYYNERIKAIDNYYKSKGLVDSEAHKEELENMELYREVDINNLNESLEKKAELEQKHFTSKEGLNEEEKEMYKKTVEYIEGLADEKFRKDEIRLELERDQIIRKYNMTGEITEEEEKKLTSILVTSYESKLEDSAEYYANRIYDLEKYIEGGGDAEGKHAREIEELHEQSFRDRENIQREGLEKMFKEFVGYTADELNEYNGKRKEIEKLDGQIQRALNRGKLEEYERLKDKKQMMEDEIIAFEELHDTNREEMAKTEEKAKDFKKIVPESFTGSIEKIKGKWDVSFLSDNVSDETVEAYNAGEDVGDNTAKGTAKGITKNEGFIRRMGRNLVQWIKGSAEKEADIRSPSRVFAEIGGFMAQGVGVGIEEDTPYAIKAVQDMTKQMVDETDGLDVGLNATASRNVVTQYQNKGYEQFTDTMSRTIVRELSRNPLRAVINEDDFEDGVSDVIYHEMRRG